MPLLQGWVSGLLQATSLHPHSSPHTAPSLLKLRGEGGPWTVWQVALQPYGVPKQPRHAWSQVLASYLGSRTFVLAGLSSFRRLLRWGSLCCPAADPAECMQMLG